MSSKLVGLLATGFVLLSGNFLSAADEEGILIQDEFPIWNMERGKAAEYNVEGLAAEYREWMQERWNHPSVVIWDARLKFAVDLPTDAGSYQVEATLVRPGSESVRSLRDFRIPEV